LITLILLLLGTLFLAYANGANDNFKGVATLYGSQTLGYRPAKRSVPGDQVQRDHKPPRTART